MAYRDLNKIARQIVLGFFLFLFGTFAVILNIDVDRFLESLKIGVLFNVVMSPVYYHYFGDRHEFKFKKI